MLTNFCKIMKLKFSLLAFLLITSVSAFTQNQKSWGLEARFSPGFLVGHRVVMGHLPKNHTYAMELGFIYRTNGQKQWHQYYKYPELSVNLYYGSVGNTPILGNFFGVYSNIALPFIAKEKFRLNGRLGFGLGYTPKVYDEVDNQKNVAIASHISALVKMGIEGKYYFGNNWLGLGAEITHFSNAGMKVPNLGLNIPNVSLTYGRYIHKADKFATNVEEFPLPRRRLLLGATAIFSAKQMFPTGGKTYPVYALSLHARMFLKPKQGWEVAFDIFSKQAILGYRTEVDKTQADILQLGVYAGYLLPLNNFHFVLGMGAYVKDFYKPDGPLYHRVGMRYYLKNGVHFNLVLKAHWGKADYAEFGVGYSFMNLFKKD